MTAPVDPAILARALALYGLDPAACRFIGGFESQVFEARRGGGTFVLKLGDPGHRSRDAVEAECECDPPGRPARGAGPVVSRLPGAPQAAHPRRSAGVPEAG